jgi:putative transposase
MARPATVIELSTGERAELERMVTSRTIERRMAERARIVLMAAEGEETVRIAQELGTSAATVCRWRKRFADMGVVGLRDEPRAGRPRTYGYEERLKVIRRVAESPSDATRWTVRDLAADLAEEVGMSKSHLARVLKELDLKPHQFRMWLNSQDPEFEAKQAEIVALYLNPPENALVICVDEKGPIQALEPVHPDTPARPGIPSRREFEYRRHGTTSLFAAFFVHEGTLLGECRKRRTLRDFMAFLEKLYRGCPRRKHLHIVLDNLPNVHDHPEVKRWLKAHPRVHFHYTPTHASWLSQIELWFSILSRRLLKRGAFSSVDDLIAQIMAFIERYNKRARPFTWTYTGDPLKL